MLDNTMSTFMLILPCPFANGGMHGRKEDVRHPHQQRPSQEAEDSQRPPGKAHQLPFRRSYPRTTEEVRKKIKVIPI